MYRITLDQAEALIEAAATEAARHAMKPLTLGVFDATGALIALDRPEGAPMIGARVVAAKAGGALALGMSSRMVGELHLARPHVLGAVGSLTNNGIVPAAGALLVKDAKGTVIGAMAASGDTSDNDELAVAAAIKAAGLETA